jgi:arylformamidase
MSEWIDISVPLSNGMASWPGDEPFQHEQILHLERGDVCNLSKLTTTAHIGTHMDAPCHFVKGGAGIDKMPIDATIGRARVIGIEDREKIRIAELEPHGIRAGERILFRTCNSECEWHAEEFRTRFVYIPQDTARYLASTGLRTIGIDYLSVGGFESDSAETHEALLGAGIWIIEGLNLGAVEPGEYELVCLPLKIAGGDGAPARAVLRRVATTSL